MSDENEVKLTWKQKAFIQEYLLDFNATQAMIRAGYSAKYAHTNVTKLLRNTTIAAAIKEELDIRALSAEEALDVISQHAKADMGDYLETNRLGFSLNLSDIKERGLSRPIKKIKQRTTTYLSKKEDDEDREVHELEIELYDAQAAADKILRVHGRYKQADQDARDVIIRVVYEDKESS